MKGTLYICPTPIGNLEDITLRTLRIFSEVDIIACEDTRHTIKLLNYYDIKKKTTSYHEHNKASRGPELIRLLASGNSIALVSDAGMPGLSDPGADLVQLVIEAEIPFTVLPGASAVLPALVGSGLETKQFLFVGFLESQASKRKKQIKTLEYIPYTLVVYEAPHRLLSTLKFCEEVLGQRNAVVTRELTKKFETYHRGSFTCLIEHFENETPRGEIVLLIEGYIAGDPVEDSRTIEAHLAELISEGMTKKEAVKQVAKERQLKKQEVYMIATGIDTQ